MLEFNIRLIRTCAFFGLVGQYREDYYVVSHTLLSNGPGGIREHALAAAVGVEGWLGAVGGAPDTAGVGSADGADFFVGGGFPASPDFGFEDAMNDGDDVLDDGNGDFGDLVEDGLAHRLELVAGGGLGAVGGAAIVADPSDWHGISPCGAYW